MLQQTNNINVQHIIRKNKKMINMFRMIQSTMYRYFYELKQSHPTVKITKEFENEVFEYVLSILAVYDKCRTDDRQNFLSFAYIAKKIFELLDRQDLSSLMTLKKCRKFHNFSSSHDKIWEKICHENSWKFIQTN